MRALPVLGPADPAGGGAGARRVLLATLLGVFVTSFPSVILVAALPDIARDFDVRETSVGWVLTSPMIAAAVLVPLFGRMGDLRGHRQVFLFGFSVSGAFAVLSALAWDLGPLIVFRTISQAAGMATSPTALALLMATYGPADRPRALGYWAFAGASAPVVGLLAGGPFVGAVGWRGLFVLSSAVIFLALPFCWRTLPRTPRVPGVRFDLAGGALLMLGSGAAIFALDRSARWGFTSPAVLGPALLSPLVLWAFVRVERRTDDPLLPLELLRRRAFVSPVVGEFLIQVPSIGAFFLAPLVLTSVFDRSVVEAAYLLIPMPLGMSASAPLGGWLTARIGERRTGIAGAALLLVAIGVAAYGAEAELLPVLVLGFALHGGGIGLSQPALASAAAGSLPTGTTGVGMAVMRMMTQLGSATGITVAVAGVEASGYVLAYGLLGVACAGAVVAAASMAGRERALAPAAAAAATASAFDV